jgi:hypothetical protein
VKPNFDIDILEKTGFCLVIARFVKENQISEIIEAYLSSGRTEVLVVIGAGTGRRKYERKINNLSHTTDRVLILPKHYIRAEINWLLQNAKVYLHGHSVGGTNPILVDARFHSKVILSHTNPYNMENSGYKELHWASKSELVLLLDNLENFQLNKSIEYRFESWKSITDQYIRFFERV